MALPEEGAGYSVGALVLVVSTIAVCAGLFGISDLTPGGVRPALALAMVAVTICSVIVAALFARYVVGLRRWRRAGMVVGMAAAAVLNALMLVPQERLPMLFLTAAVGCVILLAVGALVGWMAKGALAEEPEEASDGDSTDA